MASIFTDALNFVALPQPPTESEISPVSVAGLSLTKPEYESLMRLPSMPAPMLAAKRKHPDGHNQKLVTNWLESDLSYTASAAPAGNRHTPFWELGQ